LARIDANLVRKELASLCDVEKRSADLLSIVPPVPPWAALESLDGIVTSLIPLQQRQKTLT
jgi:hypothetical protein